MRKKMMIMRLGKGRSQQARDFMSKRRGSYGIRKSVNRFSFVFLVRKISSLDKNNVAMIVVFSDILCFLKKDSKKFQG